MAYDGGLSLENIETVAIGEPDSSWQSGLAKTITFIVTEACQLRCGYCYIIGKNETNRMTFTVAKASVDYILRNRKLFNEKSSGISSVANRCWKST